MKYGGELVDALDCTHRDFKILIPLCPVCSEPVLLHKGSNRVSKKGKAFQIPQHWSHFPSVSEEQKAACEARVSGYSEGDRQRIRAKARKQRLKWVERSFLAWYTESLGISPKDWRKLCTYVRRNHPDYVKKAKVFIRSIKRTESRGIARRLVDSLTFELPQGNSQLIPGEPEFLQRFQAIDNGFHRQIVKEVLDFLLSRAASSLLENLSVELFWNVDQHIISDKNVAVYASQFIREYNGTQFMLEALINRLLCVSWASKFARLEGEQQHRGSA